MLNLKLYKQAQRLLQAFSNMKQKCAVHVTKRFETANLPHGRGMDVHLQYDYMLRPSQTKQLIVNSRYVLPCGFKVTVHPRSSTAVRGMLVHTTVINAEYNGRLFIIATNLSKEDIVLSKGTRIAQIEISPVTPVEFKLVNVTELEEGDRNERCLGSTGKETKYYGLK